MQATESYIITNKESNAYSYLIDYLNEKKHSSIILLCDTNTKKYCLHILLNELKDLSYPIIIIEIPEGEINKSIESSQYIWKTLLENNCDRKALMINLGGGMITDIGGFISSIYKRGISFVNIPTTLLAMVDAGIGGKTGIDFNSVKNVLGSFNLPELTIIDTYYLNTLDNREMFNGYAEMLKHGLIADKNHWNDMSNVNPLNINYKNIEHSISIKRKIVETDLKEVNIRKTLNFGHTIGHGIESFFIDHEPSKYIKHGEAVAIGILLESYLSEQIGLLNKKLFLEIEEIIISKFGVVKLEESTYRPILRYLKNDKKNVKGNILFILLKDLGIAVYDIPVNEELIVKSLEYYTSLSTGSHHN